MFEPRFYREWTKSNDLVSFEVIESQTDLFISTDRDLEKEAIVSLKKHRGHLEGFIKEHPHFIEALMREVEEF